VPELPEIEHLRRTLEPVLVGASVTRVRLLRADVLRARLAGTGGRLWAAARSLLGGARIEVLSRHGKELAVVAHDGRVLCIHLGMSGQLRFVPAGSPLPRRDHVHCQWLVHSPAGAGRLVFRDPRRFGGLWGYATVGALRRERWARLGPDALDVAPAVIRQALARTRRPVKAALLDQRLIAGVGNIYADEALFAAGVHPLTPACRLDPAASRRLAAALRAILRRAIRWGGSSLRDYVDATGGPGRFAARHKVYGRASLPCVRCGSTLEGRQVGQRTTVFCPGCQGTRRRKRRN
jgi:formamidopyrimidine-DNA glycosylase